MFEATISKITLVPYSSDELGNKSGDERKEVESCGYEKPTGFAYLDKIVSENIQTFRKRILDACKENHPTPILVTLNYDARVKLNLKFDPQVQHRIADSSFIVGRSYRHNEPEAVFEFIIFLTKDGQMEEVVRVLSRDHNKGAMTEEYYFQLQSANPNYGAASNRLPEPKSVAHWPE